MAKFLDLCRKDAQYSSIDVPREDGGEKPPGALMPETRDEVTYLRHQARKFRVLAQTYETEVSGQLLEIAAEFEDYADQLEVRRARAGQVAR